MYANLKLQLWRMGMRQNQLAKYLHMDETMLSKIVNGFREPSPVLRQKIADALRMDENWLFEVPAGGTDESRRRLSAGRLPRT